MKAHYCIDTTMGTLICVAESRRLERIYPPDVIPNPNAIGVEAPLRWLELEEQLYRYFEGERVEFTIETAPPPGTAFQQQVWAAVAAIPYGQQRTYRDIGAAIGDVYKARAVGQAIARHPLPIIFPGHRVVGTGGRLKGTAPGLPLKRFLLNLEAGALPEHGEPA